jgi:SAM-dependent methyltransferase
MAKPLMRSGIRVLVAVVSRRRFCLGALAAACLLAAGVDEADAQTRTRHGKLFAPQDLGLLEGPDRDLWQLPDQIMDTLGIAEGSEVADIGAGGGWFTIRLARRVGANGLVYAEDIQPQMLESTMRRVAREGLGNVRRVLGTAEDPRLPARRLDAVLIVDTYHELENPGALLRNIAESLKPQGRVGVVDFKRDGLGPGPALDDRVDPDEVVRDAEAAGLRLVRRETFLPYQFLLVFSRPQSGTQ